MEQFFIDDIQFAQLSSFQTPKCWKATFSSRGQEVPKITEGSLLLKIWISEAIIIFHNEFGSATKLLVSLSVWNDEISF